LSGGEGRRLRQKSRALSPLVGPTHTALSLPPIILENSLYKAQKVRITKNKNKSICLPCLPYCVGSLRFLVSTCYHVVCVCVCVRVKERDHEPIPFNKYMKQRISVKRRMNITPLYKDCCILGYDAANSVSKFQMNLLIQTSG
jgi:hypothetical protein